MKITSVCQIRDSVLAVYGNRARPDNGSITRAIVAWGIVEEENGETVACGLTMQEEDARLVPATVFPDFIAYAPVNDFARDWNAYAIAWTKKKYPQQQEEEKK